ncbi:MAG: site-specific DNA-methyltransferase [Candidatus Nanoarchaeia archaeon]|nr:site-specific DNA-methyltransferase [Candidatus Nanoarchaeia archaeon]
MTEKKIKITEAKGRPMLNWVGKKPLDFIKSFPAQLVEVFDPTGESKQLENPTFDDLKDNWQNLIFHGDNKEVLGYLLANGFRGKVDLIYIDPPFDSAANYLRRVELRGKKQKSKLEGEDYNLGEQLQYHDIWANDNYLQFIYERLLLLKELLSNGGVIVLHCDDNKEHHLRCLLEEVFGSNNFLNWVAYRTDVSRGRKVDSSFFGNNLNMLFFYSKNKEEANKNYNKLSIFEKIENPEKQGFLKDEKGFFSHSDAGSYSKYSLYNFAKENKLYSGNGTKYELDEINKTLKIISGKPRIKYYLEFKDGSYFKEKVIDNVWEDLLGIANQSGQDTGYPTQKVEELLNRVINSSSNKNSIVLDCFMGSGTTQAVAQKLNRKWIGVDINKGSIQTTAKRIQKIISEQSKNGKQKTLSENSEQKYLSFAHYKVNDYDLQLLRTEAIELAVQHIGIQRIKTDNFFEGTLGKNLVKIIDFNHPLTLLDLQLIQNELKKRPDENRNVTIVCLGKELSTDSYIEDYNKKHPVNKIEVVELRTDSKYGKFLIHKPAQAKVSIKRKGDKAQIELKDFISPSIIERLNDGEKLIKVKIPDFRSMIDVVLIDTEYNGKVFNIKYSDVPEKKKDFVLGKYELDIPKKTTIAVKIIDMLGEEVLITEEI